MTEIATKRLPAPATQKSGYTVVCSGILALSAVLIPSIRVEAFQPKPDRPHGSDQLYLFPPETPEQQAAAAITATKLQRPEVAREFLRTLLEQQLPPERLAALRNNIGIGQLLWLNGHSTLQPEARQLLISVNEAARESALSDEDLKSLVDSLGQGGNAARDSIVKLLSAGPRAVPALLAAKPDGTSGILAQRVLHRYAREFRTGLLTSLPTADQETQQRIIELLGSSADSDIAFDLLKYRFSSDVSEAVSSAADKAIGRLATFGPLPVSHAQALQLLTGEIRRQLQFGGRRFDTDRPSPPSLLAVEPESAYPVDYHNQRAIQLAENAADLAPDDSEVRALQLVSMLASSRDGNEQTDNEKVTPPLADILAALDEALSTGNSAAGVGALRLLSGTTHDAISSTTESFGESASAVLNRALISPDVRIRGMAASLLISSPSLDSTAMLVSETRAAVLAGAAVPEALVIDADLDRQTELKSALTDSGYATTAARTGVDGFQSLSKQLNCELILIHSNCIRWDLSLTVANLRADVRTRLTPIVIYGPEYAERSAKNLSGRYPGIWFLPEPLGARTLDIALGLERIPGPLVPATDRLALKSVFASGTAEP